MKNDGPLTHDPADNRFRLNQKLLPLVDEYRRTQCLDTRTAALNSMVIRAIEALRREKPQTTPVKYGARRP